MLHSVDTHCKRCGARFVGFSNDEELEHGVLCGACKRADATGDTTNPKERLKEETAWMEAHTPIDSFRGRYYFLSNFYQCDITIDGLTYPSSEAAFHAMKTLSQSDREILTTMFDASAAKRFGWSVKMRDDWNSVKVREMRRILYAKFRQNPELYELLKETANRELIEGNTWGDKFWGVCRGQGRNNLGRLLMEIRDRGLDSE